MKPFDIFLIVVSTFFLGTNLVAVKIGVGEFPPLFLMGLRFSVVVLILIGFVKPPKGSMAAVIVLFSTPQLFLLSFLVEDGQMAALGSASPIGWFSLLYAAVVASIIGYGLWYYLIAKFKVSAITPYALLSPLFGITAAVLLLGDEMTTARIVGGMLTLIGVAFVQSRSNKAVAQEK